MINSLSVVGTYQYFVIILSCILHTVNLPQEHFVINDNMIVKPAENPAEVEVVRGPNIKPFPLGKALEGKVKKVELTSRLKSHPCCLRAEGPVTLEMEKVLNQQAAVNGGQSVHAERVLELNAEHPIFKKLCALQAEGSDKVSTYADILYTQALLIEGMPVDDPVAYANAVCNLLS